jgi:hypothetical protein
MMNDADDINALKIAQYLEDGMSPGEEVAFMKELNEDEVLRKSFEEVLLLREVLVGHAKTPTRVVSLFRMRAIAAGCVAVMLLCFGIARLPVSEHHYATNADGAVAPRADVVSQFPVNSAAVVAVRPDSLFTEFYSAYIGEKDPVEISLYYQRYRAGDYASVLAAREDDYRLMGTGGKSGVLNQYMQLYRGLSYLAERQPVRALGQFDSLLVSPHVSKVVYCSAQWYAVLASLQRKDISADSALGAAARGARAIGQTDSPYRQQAAILSDLLSGH